MPSPSPEILRQQVIDYLLGQVEAGSAYVKSRHIATELNASAKRIGLLLAALEAEEPSITLERWGGNSDGTTWYVEVDPDEIRPSPNVSASRDVFDST